MELFCFLSPFDWFSCQIAKSGNGSVKRLDTTADSFVKHRKLALLSVYVAFSDLVFSFKMAEKATSFLPGDWDDDDRMNFMFSAFNESREVNPKHWDSKLNYWTKAIIDSCKHHGDVCINVTNLRQRFSRNGLVPLGLTTVIKELFRSGKLERKQDFVRRENKGWLTWSYSLAKESFWWGVSALSGRSGNVVTSLNESEELVLVDAAKEKGDLILRRHYESVQCETTDYVIPWNVLKARFKEFDEETLSVLVASLQRQGKAALFTTTEDEKIVKFAKKMELKVAPVSENDVDIVRLRKTVAKLTIQVTKLSNEVESCRLQAARFVREGSRSQALKLLKKKETRQRTLDKVSASLASLEEIIHRIQHANTNKMVIDALKTGTATLKGLHAEMDIDSVEDTMDELNETLGVSRDIDAAISQGNQFAVESSGIRDDELDELEKELESLMISDTGNIAASQPSLPSPLQQKIIDPSGGHASLSLRSPLSGLSPRQESCTDIDVSNWPSVPNHDPDSEEPKKKTVLLSK
ncbi:PREDICTED: charged multivesicular body protein 7-like isoform X1 [Acropora digitifera]|uniref:charged multivesicular body protein 7-like isoform X1 n=1 Tax=Acropora digitifera TaxID=70779 RepID=UPI00077B05E6|nr:PREDICTED: charged multivesicular body protein 7-like isoform X1 [Acropora digitifera]